MAVFVIVVMQLPTLLSAALLVAQNGSDHELRCDVSQDGIHVSLVHSNQSGVHQHNALERILLCQAADAPDHPDHRFSFSQPSALDTQRAGDTLTLPSHPMEISPLSAMVPCKYPAHVCRVPALLSGGPLELPRDCRRGTVLLF